MEEPNYIIGQSKSGIEMKRRLSVTNLSSENNLLTFRLNGPVIIRVKVKKCEQTLLFIPRVHNNKSVQLPYGFYTRHLDG